MNTKACLVAGCAALLAACSGLPDLDRGKAALKAGDLVAAEKDLRPLAERGYADARMQMAKLHAQAQTPEELRLAADFYTAALPEDPAVAVPLARVLLQLGDLQSIAKAEEALTQAHAQGDPRALSTLIGIYTEYPELDTRKAAPGLVARADALGTLETESAVIKWYRRNSADPKYAKALINRCSKAQKHNPECYIDMVRYYRTNKQKNELKELVSVALSRYNSGDLSPDVMERLGWSLVSDDIAGEAYPESAYQMIKQVAKDSAQAQVRLARLLVEYPYVDPDGKPEELLLKAVATGNADAALGLGRLYMNGTTVPVDPAKAVKYLDMAAPTLPAAHFFLGRIHKRGQLGRPDPVRAAQHFLDAARGGYAKADAALAQLYSDNKGVRPNLANAYVFASIAVANAVPEGQELLNQFQASMTPKQVQDGKRLLQEEMATRRGISLTAAGSASRTAPTQESAP